MQIEEELLLPEMFEKILRRHEDILVGPPNRGSSGRVTLELGIGSGLGGVVDVESLTETEIRCHPSVAPDPDRAVTRGFEDLGRHHGFVRNRIVETQHAMSGGIGSRPERSHGGLRPARLGDHPLEDDPVIREIVDDGRGWAPVSVEAQPIRAKRVDEDEYDVQIAASPQQGEILDRSPGSRRDAQIELQRDDDQQQNRRSGKIRRRGIQQPPRHRLAAHTSAAQQRETHDAGSEQQQRAGLRDKIEGQPGEQSLFVAIAARNALCEDL